MKATILKSLFTIAISLSVLGATQSVAHADAVKATDTTGNITGAAGTTYYQVSSWSDINQAYSNDTSSSVYVQAQSDFSQDSNLGSHVYKLTSGKNLTIDGNDKTLNLSSGATTGTGESGGGQGTVTHAFSDNDNRTTAADKFTLKNATLINNIDNGLFQINGAANITYDNVTETNSNTTYNARPFFNWAGSITLKGTTQFNIIGGATNVIAGDGVQDIAGQGYTSTTGYDQNGEWIRGNASIDVYDSATLNFNWWWDQPYWSDAPTQGLGITVHDNSHFYWNMNNSYMVDFSQAQLNCNIGNNASFIITGSKNTFAPSLGTGYYQSKAINIAMGDNSQFSSTSGAEMQHLNSLTTGQNDKVAIQNLGSGRAIQSLYNSQSSMSLSDSTDATFSGNTANIIYPSNLSISLLGSGLATNASKLNTPDTSTNSFTKDPISGTFTSAFTSSLYSSTEQAILKSAKYIHWYPGKAIAGFTNSVADRSFHVTADMLTHDQNFSSPISGDSAMTFGIHNSSVNTPSLSLSVKLTNNKTPDTTQYVWRNIDGSTSQPLSDTPITIATLSPNQELASNIVKSTTATGSDYVISFNPNQGLLLQSKNTIQSGTFQNASMTYEITNGPT